MFALLAALIMFIGAAIVVSVDELSNTVLWMILFGGLGMWALHAAFPIKLTKPGR